MSHEPLIDLKLEDLLPARRILAPIDFSTASNASLLQAIKLAGEYQAELEVLHVSAPLSAPEGCSAREYLAAQQRSRARTSEEMLQLVNELSTGRFAGPLRFTSLEGVPSQEIVKTAQEHDSDLIVISTHGATGFRRFFIGSTAEKVVRFAPCSVYLFRPKLKGPVLPPEEIS